MSQAARNFAAAERADWEKIFCWPSDSIMFDVTHPRLERDNFMKEEIERVKGIFREKLGVTLD